MKFYRSFVSFIILIFSAGWIIYSHFQFPVVQTENLEVPRKGFQAPVFGLNDLEGIAHDLTAYYGYPVIINFWASWCTPCVKEMPALQKIYDDYSPEKLVVLGVNMTQQDSVIQIEQFISKQRIVFPVLLDSQGTVGQLYHVRALPTTFFVGKDGQIVDVIIGGPLPEAALHAKVSQLLEGTP